jgi:hypothetical protein
MIMIKHRISDRNAICGWRQRKSVTLEEKLDVILRYECDGCKVDIASAPGIPESAIITIRHQADKVKENLSVQ